MHFSSMTKMNTLMWDSLNLIFNRAFKSCGPGGPPHVKIVVEWDKETKD